METLTNLTALISALIIGSLIFPAPQSNVPKKVADSHVSVHNKGSRNTTKANQLKTSPVKQFSITPSWKQDFSKMPNGPIDTAVWNVVEGNNNGWGNGEAQVYTNNTNNIRVDDGDLVIEAKKTDGQYTSARITTEDKFDFTYGKMDIVAKLPTGQGVWPALWFWPTDKKYSTEPVRSNERDMTWLNDGEIDLVEGSAQGDSGFSGSAHSLAHYPGHSERTGSLEITVPSTRYHTYSLQWTPQALDFMVDGSVFKHVDNNRSGFRDWPYNQRYHLIMNIAMGGSMSSNLVSESMPKGIDDNALPAQLKVQSISYYPFVGK
jgi:beta-glucanase (GH16 family)